MLHRGVEMSNGFVAVCHSPLLQRRGDPTGPGRGGGVSEPAGVRRRGGGRVATWWLLLGRKAATWEAGLSGALAPARPAFRGMTRARPWLPGQRRAPDLQSAHVSPALRASLCCL